MKNILILLVAIASFNNKSWAQTQPSVAAQEVANKIAQKMKDSLNLTDTQKNQLYEANISLYQQKFSVRQQYSNMDSLRIKTQRIENTRDSLYSNILPVSKYQQYLQRKQQLISIN